MKSPVSFKDIYHAEDMAERIGNLWLTWDQQRRPWKNAVEELKRYLYATDTKSTTNSTLPWKNSTTIPKLTQLRDVLHSHYMAALFPNEDWLKWVALTTDANKKELAQKIQAFMQRKLELNNFIAEVSKLVYDYIDYGNAFGTVVYNEEKIETAGGSYYTARGPELRRIAPTDIVFNPTVDKFNDSPTITRSFMTVGELVAKIKSDPGLGYSEEVVSKLRQRRLELRQYPTADLQAVTDFRIDGFGDFSSYITGDYVELLEYQGDWYDMDTGVLHENQVITIVDRAYVIRQRTRESYLRNSIFHAGWRLRPDNLWAMGPLENLVGMQYRIDHIENAKADAIDQYIHPIIKIKGMVEDFESIPGERIIIGDDGDVIFERPDLGFLQYDAEIQYYLQLMEEIAGAPKDLAGVRTPGNKTLFEVDQLQNNSQKLFLNKVEYFESIFLEKILNAMLDVAKRRMGDAEIISVPDEEFGVITFETISVTDLSQDGFLKPMGARHYARKQRILRDLVEFANSPLGQDSSINVHLSGKTIAKLVEELLDMEKFALFRDNVRVIEQAETQRVMNAAAASIQMEDSVRTEIDETDIPENDE